MENDPAHSSQEPTSLEDTSETIALSKKAQKKALKMARHQERKMERRVKERAAKKEKKRKRAERIAAGEELSEDERTQKRAKMSQEKEPFAARVVLDLGFDDKMSDKEISSLCSQLAYVYSVNRRSPNPFRSLLYTSLNGRTLSRLDQINKGGHKRWTGTEWWTEGYDRLWLQNSGQSALGDGESSGDASRQEDYLEEDGDGSNADQLSTTPVSQDSVVYLTADSNEVLEELKEGETYVIGGLCDHNRYKNLCLDRARESGVRTAQLPIGRFLSHLPTRKVLTVNQVFEILMKWVETRDWELSLYAVIPKRKFQDCVSHEEPNEENIADTAMEGQTP